MKIRIYALPRAYIQITSRVYTHKLMRGIKKRNAPKVWRIPFTIKRLY